MGDFHVHINKDETIGHNKLNIFCNTLNLSNLVKSDTCYTNNHKSTTLFPLVHQCTNVTEKSHYHGLIATFMKSHSLRLQPKIIHYHNFKRFDEQKFIADVKNAGFLFEIGDPIENFSTLTLFL